MRARAAALVSTAASALPSPLPMPVSLLRQRSISCCATVSSTQPKRRFSMPSAENARP